MVQLSDSVQFVHAVSQFGKGRHICVPIWPHHLTQSVGVANAWLEWGEFNSKV